MNIREHLGWIFTRWHFWMLVAAYSLWTIIKDTREFGELIPAVLVGNVAGSFIFMFIIYIVVRFIVVMVGKKK